MRGESCGLKSSMLEVRGGTRDTNKGCGGEKKRRDQSSDMANAVTDWRERKRTVKRTDERREGPA